MQGYADGDVWGGGRHALQFLRDYKRSGHEVGALMWIGNLDQISTFNSLFVPLSFL